MDYLLVKVINGSNMLKRQAFVHFAIKKLKDMKNGRKQTLFLMKNNRRRFNKGVLQNVMLQLFNCDLSIESAFDREVKKRWGIVW
jgi:hypothetical protein